MTTAEIKKLIDLQSKSHRKAFITSLKRARFIDTVENWFKWDRLQPQYNAEAVYEEYDAHSQIPLVYYAKDQLDTEEAK